MSNSHYFKLIQITSLEGMVSVNMEIFWQSMPITTCVDNYVPISRLLPLFYSHFQSSQVFGFYLKQPVAKRYPGVFCKPAIEMV